MDVDSTADPTRIVAESAAAGVTPPEVIVPEGTVLSGSGSRAAAPDAPAGEAVKETPVASAAVRGSEPASSGAIPVGAPVESAIIGGLKESLVKATQFELRLRELASKAELVKSNMHVSTYVSFPAQWV